MIPTLGQIVHYRGKQGRLAMRSAVITGTTDSLDPDGIASGDVPALTDDKHVHLWVFTPGQSGGFPEFNVPPAPQHSEPSPGEWCWPSRPGPRQRTIPSLGRIVLADVDPAQNNGSETAPAVITRVWNDLPDGRWIVNVRVLVDSDAVPLFLSSVYLHAQEPDERGHSVWWPPRV